MTKFCDPAQVRLAQLEGEIQRVTRFGTWEGWSSEDANYLLGELRHWLVEDFPFPSHNELVAVAIDAYQKALGSEPTEDEVFRDLLQLALTVERIARGPSVADEVIALLDRHLVKSGFPSVGHVPCDQ
ncbi:hypothetical protein [Pseudomonas aeruginosa]